MASDPTSGQWIIYNHCRKPTPPTCWNPHPPSVIGIADHHGLRPGARADLVVLSTHRVADALLDRPDRCYGIKAGRIVARTTRTHTLLRAADAEFRAGHSLAG